jgi:uncharacterized membrane protein YbhN (UPF0104 family)
VAVWFLGKYVHSYVLTAAAPRLTRRRALAVNLTGGAVASVMPFGGAAGLEVNRRMMRTWEVDGSGFAGYAFLINVWSVGVKLLLPALAVLVLVADDQHVGAALAATAYSTSVMFVVLACGATLLLCSSRGAPALGALIDRGVRRAAARWGRSYEPQAAVALAGLRQDCGRLVAGGWWRMTLGIAGCAALDCALLGLCLHLTGAHNSAAQVVAGFAVERTLTIVPLTPGGAGVGDLGLVGMLLAFGGNPVGVAAAAVLYRTFTFAVGVPLGACLLGIWALRLRSVVHPGRRWSLSSTAPSRWARPASVGETVSDPAVSPSAGTEVSPSAATYSKV